MNRYHLIFLFTVLLQACSAPEPSEIQFTSPDGICQVVVASTGGNWRAPARVTVSVTANQQALSSTIEVYHDRLTPENCMVEWNDGMGTLTLKHRDGAAREMEIHYTGEKLYMVDRKSMNE